MNNISRLEHLRTVRFALIVAMEADRSAIHATRRVNSKAHVKELSDEIEAFKNSLVIIEKEMEL